MLGASAAAAAPPSSIIQKWRFSLTENGGIAINSMQQSNIPHIFAVGDCTGGHALASIAMKQGKVAADVLSGHRVQFAPLVTPLVVHTTPEIATVGYSAEEAIQRNYSIVTGRFPLAGNAGYRDGRDAYRPFRDSLCSPWP